MTIDTACEIRNCLCIIRGRTQLIERFIKAGQIDRVQYSLNEIADAERRIGAIVAAEERPAVEAERERLAARA